jgi:hypothetical protein
VSVHAFDVKDPKHATVYDSGVIVAEMAGRLFEFRCGPHTAKDLPGFWAVFIDTKNPHDFDECEECEEPSLYYSNTSHGATLPEAICCAARAAYHNDRENIED